MIHIDILDVKKEGDDDGKKTRKKKAGRYHENHDIHTVKEIKYFKL